MAISKEHMKYVYMALIALAIVYLANNNQMMFDLVKPREPLTHTVE